MSFWTPGPHRHRWWSEDSVNLLQNGVRTGIILVYECHSCGSLRYDKVDGTGFVSSTVTDDDGVIVSGSGAESAAVKQAEAA